jgi:hypothetical protein
MDLLIQGLVCFAWGGIRVHFKKRKIGIGCEGRCLGRGLAITEAKMPAPSLSSFGGHRPNAEANFSHLFHLWGYIDNAAFELQLRATQNSQNSSGKARNGPQHSKSTTSCSSSRTGSRLKRKAGAFMLNHYSDTAGYVKRTFSQGGCHTFPSIYRACSRHFLLFCSPLPFPAGTNVHRVCYYTCLFYLAKSFS